MTEDLKNVVNRFWEEAYNEENPDVMDEIFAPGYVLHELSSGQDGNLDSLKSTISAVHADLPGTRVTIEDQMAAEGDRVVTRFTIHVPQQGDTATGSAETMLEFSGISISRVSGGQIEESWLYWESLRAEQEISEPVHGWRWPPWRW